MPRVSHETRRIRHTNHRRLGVRACQESVQLLNDPAAPLFLLERKGSRAWDQILIELETDLAERSPEGEKNSAGFHYTFYFDVDESGRMLSADSGQEMQAILDESVEKVAGLGDYALAREKARQTEAQQITDWLQSGGAGYSLKSSLCPDEEELDSATAKQLSFRQKSKMSVMSVYSYQDGRLRGDYFSLFNHDLELQNRILEYLGINRRPEASTLDELKHLDIFNFEGDVVKDLKQFLGQKSVITLNTEKVNACKQLYAKIVDLCRQSEEVGYCINELATECAKLAVPIDYGGIFGRNDSRKILDHLRRVALPHSLYGTQSDIRLSSDANHAQAIYEASRQASASGATYDSVCPTNYQSQSTITSSMFVDTLFHARKQSFELRSRFVGFGPCSSCSPKEQVALYGCGVFCRACNEVWCDEWERSGAQLKPAQVRMRRVITKRPQQTARTSSWWFSSF